MEEWTRERLYVIHEIESMKIEIKIADNEIKDANATLKGLKNFLAGSKRRMAQLKKQLTQINKSKPKASAKASPPPQPKPGPFSPPPQSKPGPFSPQPPPPPPPPPEPHPDQFREPVKMTKAAALKILGLNSKATKAEVKKAYYSLSRQHHPDKSKHPNAQVIFQIINNAYHKIVGASRGVSYYYY